MANVTYKKSIVGTNASLLTFNGENNCCEVIDVYVPRRFKSVNDLFNYCRKMFETETLSVIKINNYNTVKRLYKISPEKYIKNADLVSEEII